MKHLLTLLVLLTLTASCSIEQRIKRLTYTNEVYYTDSETYQVYINSRGKRYIIILNKEQTNFKRHYLKY
jgi:hypothetical protein